MVMGRCPWFGDGWGLRPGLGAWAGALPRGLGWGGAGCSDPCFISQGRGGGRKSVRVFPAGYTLDSPQSSHLFSRILQLGGGVGKGYGSELKTGTENNFLLSGEFVHDFLTVQERKGIAERAPGMVYTGVTGTDFFILTSSNRTDRQPGGGIQIPPPFLGGYDRGEAAGQIQEQEKDLR
jgi:hypothetical protein